MIDITILTEKRYYNPTQITPYIQNILDEATLLMDALKTKGFTVERTYWDNPDYNWSQTKAIVFRTIWDYFERFDAFQEWLQKVHIKTILINPLSLIEWNIDKHYLKDLSEKGIRVMETDFVDKGYHRTLAEVCQHKGWKDIVIKPAISGAAFHTYKIMETEIIKNEALFEKLVGERDMLVQEFQPTIMSKGEASLMVFNGKYTHAILKKAKPGDFRVQDDFGGTVHEYQPTPEEITFAEKVFATCNPMPAYGRVDIVWDAKGNPMLSELEIIEPELWVRNHPAAAKDFAEGIAAFLK